MTVMFPSTAYSVRATALPFDWVRRLRWTVALLLVATLRLIGQTPTPDGMYQAPQPAGMDLGPDVELRQLYHKSWTAKDGAPGQIRHTAQARDGALWLATASGLYRFDGVQFTRYQLRAGQSLARLDLAAVVFDGSNGLWITYSYGGLAHLKDGLVLNYMDQDGSPLVTPTLWLRIDRAGVVWKVDVLGRLARLEGNQWKTVSSDWGFSGTAGELILDQSDTLWVVQQDGFSCLPQGSRQFAKVPYSALTSASVAPHDSKTSGQTTPIEGTHDLCSAQNAPHSIFGFASRSTNAIFIDRQGYQWTAVRGEGIRHMKLHAIQGKDDYEPPSSDAPFDTFGPNDGLTSNVVNDMEQDYEGNVWVATNKGLELFRHVPIVTAPLRSDGSHYGLVAGENGDVWTTLSVGKDNFYRITNGRPMAMKPTPPTFCMYRSPDGAIWMGGQGKILKFVDGKYKEIDTPAGPVGSISMDSQGRLWALVGGKGMFRLEKDGAWTSLASLGAPPHGSLSVFTDEQGRVWFGFVNNTIVLLDGEKVKVFSTKDGVSIGDARILNGRRGRVWIGGNRGIELFDGNRFVEVAPSDGSSFTGVTGLADRADDGIWFGEVRGVIHIPESELALARKDPAHHVRYRLFNLLDGLPGELVVPGAGQTMVEASNGILWFGTTGGLVWIDPAHIPRGEGVPRMSITALIGNGRDFDLSSVATPQLPPHTTSLQISYLAASLDLPERVLYRYQLDRVDRGWQDAGTRRQAFYTNLSPGRYRFRVIGCNADGAWNDEGVTFDFVIAPAFYQTWWFRLLYVVLALGMLWLLYLYRLRLATAQIQRRLGAQMEERERIARELHDTLLQGFQGLVLRFQAVMKMLPTDAPAREAMSQVLDRADDVLTEGRDSVRDLREGGTGAKDLAEVLARAGEELAQQNSTPFRFVVLGEPRALNPVIFKEAYRVTREAMSNASQHSRARTMEVELTYDHNGFSVRVRDDGAGIDPVTLGEGKAGHWGLSGMRERAKQMGAQLKIWSKPGAGTEVELSVPATVAYPAAPQSSIWQRLRRSIIRVRRGAKLG